MILTLFIAIIFIFSNYSKNNTVIYDCRMAEISPDFPPDVRQECRKLRLEEFKKNEKRLMV
jgi:hypothetical protein